jgi:hypothetical protein
MQAIALIKDVHAHQPSGSDLVYRSDPLIEKIRKTNPLEVLRRAQQVTRGMMDGKSQMSSAMDSGGVLEFGIGVMMFRLRAKGILTCEAGAYERMIRDLPQMRDKDGNRLLATRTTVIEHLRKTGFIDTVSPVRNLKPAGTTPSAAQVLDVTEEVTKIPVRDIISKRRSKDIVNARFMSMWVMRTISGVSFSVIGEQLGGKDHTSVINGVSQIDLRRRIDKSTRTMSNDIAEGSDYLGVKNSMDILLRQSRISAV